MLSLESRAVTLRAVSLLVLLVLAFLMGLAVGLSVLDEATACPTLEPTARPCYQATAEVLLTFCPTWAECQCKEVIR